MDKVCPEMILTTGKRVMKMKVEKLHYPKNNNQDQKPQGNKARGDGKVLGERL